MSGINLSPENWRWVHAFTAARGRPPRVLHIGNIANNAYNNAKLMNMAGLDCDVICYDYYHIMACPEWEEAEFEGDIRNPSRPKWTEVGLNGYRRPRWFAQGSMNRCRDYLLARRAGDAKTAERHWRQLGSENGTLDPGVAAESASLSEKLHKLWTVKALRMLAFRPHLLSGLEHVLWRHFPDRITAGSIGALALTIPLLAVAVILRLAILPLLLLGRRRGIRARIRDFVSEFRAAFPDRADKLTEADLWPYEPLAAAWSKLFEHYDIIQGYSTDPIIPLLAGKEYFAFEHGTLRDIPFAPTSQGRITALAYRFARHVFVTNFDCLDNARLLAGDRLTLINHPFDEDHGLAVSGWEPLRRKLCAELDSDLLFFFPTRHDWVPGTGYADKANDVFLRAFSTLRKQGRRMGLVCCRWGANVSQSMELIACSGYAAHVKWVDPMHTVGFERMALASHCVVDQFKLGAFGGIMFKAMAVGAPVCTYLDGQCILRQYPEVPPVVNCATEGDIVEKISALIGFPARLSELGAASRAWMKRYHGRDAVVNAQLDQYRLAHALT